MQGQRFARWNDNFTAHELTQINLALEERLNYLNERLKKPFVDKGDKQAAEHWFNLCLSLEREVKDVLTPMR